MVHPQIMSLQRSEALVVSHQKDEQAVNAISHELSMLQADLPHAPDEVLNEWLVPYAERLGWPPSPDRSSPPLDRWRGILSGRSLAFWACVRWRREEGPLESSELDQKSQQTLLDLYDAYVRGIPNAYGIEITDGKQRLINALAYVQKHGYVPSVIVFLESGSRLSVIDGHHRLIAYFMNKDRRFADAIGPRSTEFNATLRKWIGSCREENA